MGLTVKDKSKGMASLIDYKKLPPLNHYVTAALTKKQAQVVAKVARKLKCNASVAIRYIIATHGQKGND